MPRLSLFCRFWMHMMKYQCHIKVFACEETKRNFSLIVLLYDQKYDKRKLLKIKNKSSSIA